MEKNQGSIQYVYFLSIVAAIGGVLFGYDTAVISGAIYYMRLKFEMSPGMVGWAVGSALVGCALGTILAGFASDLFGRKRVLIVSAILFAISAIGSAVPPNLTWFIVARIVGGLGVGAASMVSPLYISEIAPANIRGRLVSLNQLGIVSGIMLIYIINALVRSFGTEAWNIDLGWRWMFASELIPATLFLVCLLFVPESPRWLTKENRDNEALKVLDKINGSDKARVELEDIKNTVGLSEQESFWTLFAPGVRLALLIGVLLAFFAQTSGINAIMYFAPKTFVEAGGDPERAFWATVIVGTVNMLFTFVALWLVDKAGRKILLLVGAAVMAFSHFMAGISLQFGLHWSVLVIFNLAFVACFAFSWGPIPWVVMSEIFPTRVRGRAMALSTIVVWIVCYLVSQTFPVLIDRIGGATFWVYSICIIVAFIFVYKVLPETKGKTLEEIEKSWTK
jgi:SP family arabinose:H+ symporter-like MFS transporter